MSVKKTPPEKKTGGKIRNTPSPHKISASIVFAPDSRHKINNNIRNTNNDNNNNNNHNNDNDNNNISICLLSLIPNNAQ